MRRKKKIVEQQIVLLTYKTPFYGELVMMDCYEQYLLNKGYEFDAVLEDGEQGSPEETRVYVRDADGAEVYVSLYGDVITAIEE